MHITEVTTEYYVLNKTYICQLCTLIYIAIKSVYMEFFSIIELEVHMEKQIGQRIRKRRKELQITQTQIQQRTHISSGNLSCIENGKYLPSAVALIELSQILNCSVDWILMGSPPIAEQAKSSNNKETLLLTGFRLLPAEEQDEFLEILQIKLHKTECHKNN